MLMGVVFCLPFGVTAAELNATVSAPVPAPVAPPAQVSVAATVNDTARLPYAMAEVIKLARAQVSDDVILSFVQNSRSTLSLSSDDIVRLRNEGVSDRVINAMLDKNARVVVGAPVNTGPAPVYADNSNPNPVDNQAPEQPVEAPLTPSGSSTYVIPYPPATAAYYGYYSPYYYPYYGGPYYYGGPIVSFGFGFGGHGFRGGHGGFHGGGFHGGSHGGGFHGGHR